MLSTRPHRGCSVVAHATPPSGGRPDPPPPPPVASIALAAAAVTLLTAAAPAHAGDAWPHGFRNGDRPRRHKRQMGGSRFDLFPADVRRLYYKGDKRSSVTVDAPDADASIIDRAADSVADMVEEAASAASRVGRVLRRAKAAVSRRGSNADDAVEFTVSASAPASLGVDPTPRLRGVAAPSAETVATIGTGAAAVAAIAAVVALAVSLRSAWTRSRRSGRWVRDRSLGGKLVWVDEGPTVTPANRRPPPPADLLPLSGDDYVPNEWDEKVEPAPSSPQASSSSGVPDWWQPPSLVRTAAATAAEAAAAPTLAYLQEAKLMGRDYDVESLVKLRRALGTTGGASRPRTANIRDAIFRAASSAAVEAASSGGGAGALGGIAPAAFVAGLAADLGVPTPDAVNIAVAAAAAKARALLVDAAAAARAAGGDPGAALLPLASLAALLKELPLSGDEPQVPLVAAAIGQRASLAERRALFLEYGRAVDAGTAAEVAALLGFEWRLVMKEL